MLEYLEDIQYGLRGSIGQIMSIAQMLQYYLYSGREFHGEEFCDDRAIWLCRTY